jgi:caffeoyl-CoA O-methyltransferase
MLTGRVQGRFLQLAVQLSGARQIVDIGTFTGYSALAMAEVLPDGGKILTIEHNPDYAKIAQNFFDQSPSGFKITLYLGEALEILKTLPDAKTDIVFIDADKDEYPDYLRHALRLTRSGSIIVADNMLWKGSVLGSHEREGTRSIHEYTRMIFNDKRLSSIIIPLGDGLAVSYRIK